MREEVSCFDHVKSRLVFLPSDWSQDNTLCWNACHQVPQGTTCSFSSLEMNCLHSGKWHMVCRLPGMRLARVESESRDADADARCTSAAVPTTVLCVDHGA